MGGRDETKWEIDCPWDKILINVLNQHNKISIKKRTKSFVDLEKLALDGLNYHWGGNRNHFIAKDVKIINDSYETFMTAINQNKRAMKSVDLVYNTNGNWMRSGNPGSATLNPLSREAICFHLLQNKKLPKLCSGSHIFYLPKNILSCFRCSL